jgi:MSHA biogenesis protein MshJ
MRQTSLWLSTGFARLSPAALRAGWRGLQRRFDQRQRRERLLLIGVCAALLMTLADRLWLAPALLAYQAARQQQASAVDALAALQAQNLALQTQGQDQRRRQATELVDWRARVRQGDTTLRRHEDAFVSPDRMVALLDHLLARQGALRLREMRSLGGSDLLDKLASPGSATAVGPATATRPTLYRHGIELVLEGSFAELLQYLQALEALPQRLQWGSVRLKVVHHPKSVLTLRIYTLSRDRHWLEI